MNSTSSDELQSRDVLCCANTYYVVTQENMAEQRRTMIANGAKPLFRCAQLYKQTTRGRSLSKKENNCHPPRGTHIGKWAAPEVNRHLGWRVGWSTATPAVPRALQPLQLITDSQAVPVHFLPSLGFLPWSPCRSASSSGTQGGEPLRRLGSVRSS